MVGTPTITTVDVVTSPVPESPFIPDPYTRGEPTESVLRVLFFVFPIGHYGFNGGVHGSVSIL